MVCITKSGWHDHFMKVFNTNDAEQRDWGDQAAEQSLTEVESLDCPTTEEGVERAIRNLTSGTSCGLDGILAEMLKSAGSSLTGFLTDCFNELFMNGDHPDL